MPADIRAQPQDTAAAVAGPDTPSPAYDPRYDYDLYPIYTPTIPESVAHSLGMSVLRGALVGHLQALRGDDCTLLSNVLLHYREGHRASYAPDFMIYLHRVPYIPETTFRTVEYGVPDLVVEVLSLETFGEDMGVKHRDYARIGIAEYWLYDPGQVRKDGIRLEGWRLAGSTQARVYEHIAPHWDASSQPPGWVYGSRVLQTVWGLDVEERMRLRDPRTGTWYAIEGDSYIEAYIQRQRADAEARRADAAIRRANAEARRADAAEAARANQAQIERLRSLLRAHGIADTDADGTDPVDD